MLTIVDHGIRGLDPLPGNALSSSRPRAPRLPPGAPPAVGKDPRTAPPARKAASALTLRAAPRPRATDPGFPPGGNVNVGPPSGTNLPDDLTSSAPPPEPAPTAPPPPPGLSPLAMAVVGVVVLVGVVMIARAA